MNDSCSVHHTCNMMHYICTRTSHDMGVSAWWRSTLCSVFDGVSWVHGYKSTLHLVLDLVGSVNGTTSK